MTQFGEGTGIPGLPGDFTPPSRFVRAAYYVSNTDKKLSRNAAILQGFRILSQFDITEGAIIDPIEKHQDETDIKFIELNKSMDLQDKKIESV